MANTVTEPTRGMLHILFDGSTDWSLLDHINQNHWQDQGLPVTRIQIYGSATDDAITIRDVGSGNGADTSSVKMTRKIFADKYDDFHKEFDGRGRWPAVDATEVSANVELFIEFAE